MKKTLTIARREFVSFFLSPLAYFLIAIFAVLAGYFFFSMVAAFNLMADRAAEMPQAFVDGTLNLNQWVVEGFFHTLVAQLLFIVPFLTMRALAEERRRGTYELLMTSPLSTASVVFGKYIGTAGVVVLLVCTGIFYPASLFLVSSPEVAPVVGGAFGLILCSLAFTSLGIAVSACTGNQVIAGVGAMVVLILLYGIHSPAESVGGLGAEILIFLSPLTHARAMFQGVITVDAIAYYLSLIAIGLFVAHRCFDQARWR